MNVYDISGMFHIAVATEDHSNADCFACAILSHGEMGEVYGINGKMKIDNITRNFKADICPTLAGKPKLFFIQVCMAGPSSGITLL